MSECKRGSARRSEPSPSRAAFASNPTRGPAVRRREAGERLGDLIANATAEQRALISEVTTAPGLTAADVLPAPTDTEGLARLLKLGERVEGVDHLLADTEAAEDVLPEPADDVTALRDWFRDNCAEWNEEPCIACGLAREHAPESCGRVKAGLPQESDTVPATPAAAKLLAETDAAVAAEIALATAKAEG